MIYKFRRLHKCQNGHVNYLYFELIGDKLTNFTWGEPKCKCPKWSIGEGYIPCAEAELLQANTTEAQQEEIEQLQATCAVMREVLEYINSYYHPEILDEMEKDVGLNRIGFDGNILYNARNKIYQIFKKDAGKKLHNEIEQLKAQLEVTREALKSTWFYFEPETVMEYCTVCGLPNENHNEGCIIGKAFSTDAGKELLDELQKYKQEAEKIPSLCQCMGYIEGACPKICPNYKEERL
jgi:hypothetical protein